MKRRNFLKDVPLAGLMVGTGALHATSLAGDYSVNPDKIEISENDDFVLNEITIGELQNKMVKGELSSKKITELYLERINKIDKAGPRLNAIIQLNPDAISIAEMMDDERRSGRLRGPLHGIPVLVKDNIDTGDNMLTTAGSLALIDNRAAKDAFIIKKLRDAGAVIIGKSNCSEWSNFRSSRPASGWSSRGGQTKNACVLDRNPSGSSSGSAVAVAANLCTISVGTETDGSIIAPSSHNGIVGIKPTVGLLSRSGIIPISYTQDTAGPMARTVSDAAILLGALCGEDNNDPVTRDNHSKIQQDYTVFLDKKGLHGKRIGIQKSHLRGHEAVVTLYKDAIEMMKKLGATIVEVDLVRKYYDVEYKEQLIFHYEFKDGINKYLKHANTKMKSLADLIEFNKKNEKMVMPYFRQETFESSQAKGDLNSKEYVDALKKKEKVRNVINNIINENKLDAISGVSIGPAGAIDLVNGDYYTGYYFCPPAAVAGYPHITVPMGKCHELPVGLSFMSTAYKEGDIISVAYAYEQSSRKREKPKFISTTIPS